MGTFLSLSAVVGKTSEEVATSLAKYARNAGGGLQLEKTDYDDPNFCSITQEKTNTTVLYPSGYLEWDESSRFLSRELGTAVFSLHIHDGDLWMYILFVNGDIVDQFNPMPDYWDEEVSDEEISSWQGNAAILAKYVPGLKPESVSKYLIRWNEDLDGTKAYPHDVNTYDEWQLIDFMNRAGLPYPLDDEGLIAGTTYKLWTAQLKLQPKADIRQAPGNAGGAAKKSWWKFWQMLPTLKQFHRAPSITWQCF